MIDLNEIFKDFVISKTPLPGIYSNILINSSVLLFCENYKGEVIIDAIVSAIKNERAFSPKRSVSYQYWCFSRSDILANNNTAKRKKSFFLTCQNEIGEIFYTDYFLFSDFEFDKVCLVYENNLLTLHLTDTVIKPFHN